MADDRKPGIVINLRQHLSGKSRPYIYPTDRAHQLRITGWTEAGLIREAMEAGFVITRAMIRTWVRRGMIPPSKQPLK